MSKRRLAWVVSIVVIVVLSLCLWEQWAPSPERQVARRLRDFTIEFNSSTTDGAGTLARAARLGHYFTPDVVVELGGGSPPIHGRETLMGMAARLQPRTAAFVLELSDVNVDLLEDNKAKVALTAVIRRRSMSSGEESMDAREFSLDVLQTGGDWRIERVAAVETLKK